MKIRAASALVAAAALVGTVAAAPEAADVTATVNGTTVSVAGTLTDALGATEFVGDAAGDAVVNELGHDLLGGTIAFPAPGRVAYSLEIAPNPATGYAPYGAQYATTLSVGNDTYELIANAVPTGLAFASQTCVEGAASQECTSSPVDGSYADGVLTWELSAPALAGSAISASEIHVAVQANVVGATLTFPGIQYDVAGLNALVSVPGAQLLLDDAPVGSLGRLTDAGFTASATDVAAGTYAASVELCDAAGDCTVVDAGEVTVG